MAALIFAIPVLLIFFFVKKREPTQREFAFWILFLIPFGLMGALWFEQERIFDFWWAYLFTWFLAAGVLLERKLK